MSFWGSLKDSPKPQKLKTTKVETTQKKKMKKTIPLEVLVLNPKIFLHLSCQACSCGGEINCCQDWHDIWWQFRGWDSCGQEQAEVLIEV